jgi:hypothetical protein
VPRPAQTFERQAYIHSNVPKRNRVKPCLVFGLRGGSNQLVSNLKVLL